MKATTAKSKSVNKIMDGLEIRQTAKGLAVHAVRAYKKGEYVYTLAGKECTPANFEEANLDGFRNHALVDPLQIGELTYLKLEAPSLYFNHSCEPNLGMRKTSELFALKNIKLGDELTFDYATTIDESFMCKCGSRKCRGAVGDFFTLPRAVKAYYFRNGALPDFINKKFISLAEGSCPCGSGKTFTACHGATKP